MGSMLSQLPRHDHQCGGDFSRHLDPGDELRDRLRPTREDAQRVGGVDFAPVVAEWDAFPRESVTTELVTAPEQSVVDTLFESINEDVVVVARAHRVMWTMGAHELASRALELSRKDARGLWVVLSGRGCLVIDHGSHDDPWGEMAARYGGGFGIQGDLVPGVSGATRSPGETGLVRRASVPLKATVIHGDHASDWVGQLNAWGARLNDLLGREQLARDLNITVQVNGAFDGFVEFPEATCVSIDRSDGTCFTEVIATFGGAVRPSPASIEAALSAAISCASAPDIERGLDSATVDRALEIVRRVGSDLRASTPSPPG